MNTKRNQKQQISEQIIPIHHLYPHPAHPFLSSFNSAALLFQAATPYAWWYMISHAMAFSSPGSLPIPFLLPLILPTDPNSSSPSTPVLFSFLTLLWIKVLWQSLWNDSFFSTLIHKPVVMEIGLSKRRHLSPLVNDEFEFALHVCLCVWGQKMIRNKRSRIEDLHEGALLVHLQMGIVGLLNCSGLKIGSVHKEQAG